MRVRGTLVFLVLVLAAASGWLVWRRTGQKHPAVPTPAAVAERAPQARPTDTAAARGLSPRGEPPSHIGDDLDSDRTDIHGDLRIVNDLFATFRSATHGLNPTGENKDITAALLGQNSLGFFFLPPDSPAVNAQGQLIDRWGTPFFFHQLSGDQMQIRSAGPDRKLYTDDDEVLTPGLYVPHL